MQLGAFSISFAVKIPMRCSDVDETKTFGRSVLGFVCMTPPKLR